MPELILAIVFVVAVGLGLVAGAFALMVGTVGFLSKLVADNIEEVNPVPREAVLSAGAAKLQETVTSVILPSAPALVGNSMYMLDVNFRSSTILGLVGAGGIGFLLYQANPGPRLPHRGRDHHQHVRGRPGNRDPDELAPQAGHLARTPEAEGARA